MIPEDLLDTPWKLKNELRRRLDWPRIRLAFALRGLPWDSSYRIYGVPVILRHRRSTMRFGSGLQLRSTVATNPLGANRPVILATWRAGAVLEIGARFGMTGGTLCASERISIGERVSVGANSTVIDTDFHPLEPSRRLAGPNAGASAPVVIEDDVFIGVGCLVLKGVCLGRGAVVGAGSVVTRDVPPGAIVAGNPARVVGRRDADPTAADTEAP